MLAQLTHRASLPQMKQLEKIRHLLVIMPAGKAAPPGAPWVGLLEATVKRKGGKFADLAKTPATGTTPDGGLVSWVVWDAARPAFSRHSALRKALAPLLEERPATLAVAVVGDGPAWAAAAAREAAYCAWLGGVPLPVQKKGEPPRPLGKLALYGVPAGTRFDDLDAIAQGNTLVRQLTALPPNALSPGRYRERLLELAAENGLTIEEHDLVQLREMGAGAFVAVAQGSPEPDAAIVRLSWRPEGAQRTLALVGKGICFDTGGHNLKPARYMHGMHEDMNGSAVALGLLLTAARLRLPVAIDAWLAVAQNHISPQAYRQNEIVTALNGTTIEVVHTDAEGRMVLADALCLAARFKPDLIVDFATLTGSMHTALGTRYCGVFASSAQLAADAVAAGEASGERVCVFPADEDYDEALESKVADVKQCTLEGEADHILATRFLSRFTDGRPWLHVDLSAVRHDGGLGAVGSDLTGFGVAWGAAFLGRWLAQ